MGEQPVAWAPKKLDGLVFDEAEGDEFIEGFA